MAGARECGHTHTHIQCRRWLGPSSPFFQSRPLPGFMIRPEALPAVADGRWQRQREDVPTSSFLPSRHSPTPKTPGCRQQESREFQGRFLTGGGLLLPPAKRPGIVAKKSGSSKLPGAGAEGRRARYQRRERLPRRPQTVRVRLLSSFKFPFPPSPPSSSRSRHHSANPVGLSALRSSLDVIDLFDVVSPSPRPIHCCSPRPYNST